MRNENNLIIFPVQVNSFTRTVYLLLLIQLCVRFVCVRYYIFLHFFFLFLKLMLITLLCLCIIYWKDLSKSGSIKNYFLIFNISISELITINSFCVE